ncbi:MAG: carboxypeptidase-like regulatory domain-containing protein [Bacteroidales bacterium]|nr:carboxypeptidase-like regulatory domain-containing protein [Bacteroidales bacterium]
MMLFFAMQIQAQERFTLSGRITEKSNGEDLIGASIVKEGTTIGTITNTYGFYSITLPKGKHSLIFSNIGFQDQVIIVDFNNNKSLDLKMEISNTEITEVVVTANRHDENISSVQMGIEKIDMKQVELLPVLFGERDVLKTIQLLPGISTISEGGSGFSVRGGSIDQNLILLDEAPVYSASHIMGFFSVFNSDALKNMDVYKGGIPAYYGGRASSVIDISMKDGNNQKFSASGGIGLISSRLTLEGPIIKDKISYIISGRRSYLDLLAKSVNIIDNETNLYFYDLNAKLNFSINNNNRLFISTYFGQDDFGFGEMGMGWGNNTGTFRWNHTYNNKLFSNTSIIYSKYEYSFNMGSDASMSSGIDDFGLKQDFSWFMNPNNTLKYGLNSTYHIFNPGELTFADNQSNEIILDKTKALESAIYISNNQDITDKIRAEYGFRLSLYNQFGEGWDNKYDSKNIKTDSIFYAEGEVMQSYWNFEPRISLNFRLSKSSSVKASYNRMAQYLHLLSNSTSGQPTDTWVSSSTNLKPLLVSQYSIGYFRNFDDNKYEFSIESYFKNMLNVTDYEDGTDIMLNENIEAYIISAKGRSYGAEFYLKKKFGRFNGWLSYTLSRTENKIDGINNEEWYAANLDKTHDISIVANYEISKNVSLSAAWVYYTGNAVTFPSGRYNYDNQIRSYYTERNGYRMPDYHRLDLNLHVKGKERKRFESSWDFSLYNAYNRYNAYTITFQESETNPGNTEAVKLSLFGIVPSVSWNFKF